MCIRDRRAQLDIGELQTPEIQLHDLGLVTDPRPDVTYLATGGHRDLRLAALGQVTLHRGRRRACQKGEILDGEQCALDLRLALSLIHI